MRILLLFSIFFSQSNCVEKHLTIIRLLPNWFGTAISLWWNWLDITRYNWYGHRVADENEIAHQFVKADSEKEPVETSDMSLLLGHSQTYLSLKSSIFWDITPCIPLKIEHCFRGICCSVTCFKQVSCWAYSSALKMVTCSSEMSFNFQWITWHHIPEDRALHNHCCENLKFYIYKLERANSLTYKSCHDKGETVLHVLC
jgi:hypothetical protein